MKKMRAAVRTFVCIGILMYVVAFSVSGQWVQANGPYGGSFETIVVKDSVLYTAVYDRGVYRSNDQGKSWTAMNEGLTGWDFYSLVFAGDELWAGTETNGVFLYSESNDRWTRFESKTGNTFNRVYNMAAQENEIWIPTDDGLVKVFKREGEWTDTMMYPLYASNDVAYTENYLFLSVRTILARTADDGFTWDTCTGGLPSTAVLSFVMLDDNTGFIAMDENKGMYTTADGGGSWAAVEGEGKSRIIDFIARNDTILCLYPEKVGISIDRGATWSDFGTGFTVDGPRELGLIGNSIILATAEGLFKSSFADREWIDISAGIVSGRVDALLKVGDVIFAGGDANGKVSRSADNGKNWVASGEGFSIFSRVHSLAYSDSVLLAGCNFQSLMQSTDFGLTWTEHEYNNDVIVAFQEINGKFLLGTMISGIVSLPDRETSLLVGLQDENKGLLREIPDCGCSTPYPGILCFTSLENTAYTSIVNYGVFAGVDTDTGMTWHRTTAGMTDSIVTALHAANGILFAGTLNDGIFRSTDKGVTWSSCEMELSGKSVNAFADYGSALFAGTGEGVFYSIDSGATWSKGETGFNEPVLSLLVDGYHLLAGTEKTGVWIRPIPEMVGVSGNRKEVASMKNGLHISSGTGNAGNVALRFDLSGKERVTLGIYDLSGKLTAKVVDRSLTPGSYRFTWNTRGVAKGSYVAKLNVGSRRWCERITVF